MSVFFLDFVFLCSCKEGHEHVFQHTHTHTNTVNENCVPLSYSADNTHSQRLVCVHIIENVDYEQRWVWENWEIFLWLALFAYPLLVERGPTSMPACQLGAFTMSESFILGLMGIFLYILFFAFHNFADTQPVVGGQLSSPLAKQSPSQCVSQLDSINCKVQHNFCFHYNALATQQRHWRNHHR